MDVGALAALPQVRAPTLSGWRCLSSGHRAQVSQDIVNISLEVGVMSLALLVVTAVRVEGRSKSAVAREYGISRRWVHELVRRYDIEGQAGLAPRSRRPHRSPTRTPVEVEEAIIAWRKKLAGQGLDAGAETIAVHLAAQTGSAPSTATIWRILTRRGFVTPQPHKRP